MVLIPIDGRTDHPLLANKVLGSASVVAGQTATTIGEAALTVELMKPRPDEWRATGSHQKYDGQFQLVVDVGQWHDIGSVAEFLWFNVHSQSENTEILQIGGVEVGEASRTRYQQLLEEAFRNGIVK